MHAASLLQYTGEFLKVRTHLDLGVTYSPFAGRLHACAETSSK